MSAILGVFGSDAPLTDGQVQAMLRRMHARGADRIQIWRDEDAVLAVARHDWELEAPFSGPVLIASDDDFVVAADASLYYRDALRQRLDDAGVHALEDTPAHLLLAAFRAWGDACAAELDGDFAWIVWDRKRRRVTCARDIGGKRPLHYARIGRELVVASTIGGVVTHPRCPTDLDLTVIAGTIPDLIFSAGPGTVYRAVAALPNAHVMSWSDGRLTEPARFWEPPVDGPASRLSHDDAADHLRELLATAALERMDPAGVNTVWMSGGWDSTAVFGAAHHAARRAGTAMRILPVSISYPKGDPGREDEYITAVADHWGVPVHWLDIADIPFFERESERAAERDEPYAHLYTNWNTALAAGSRACGSRIALDGNGGDQLFASSDMFLADLLRGGRWLSLAREWPARPRGGFRGFFGTVLQPNLPPVMLRIAAWLRGGRPLRHYLQRAIPEWMDPGFLALHDLEARDTGLLGRAGPKTHVGREIDWMFTCLFIARAFSLLGSFALSRGVELRSPLSDRRVIAFALSRPWWERSSGRETKRLLRRSMQGLLPAEVLAPRPWRTGITGGYSHRWMTDVFPGLLDDTMSAPLLLERVGIIRSDVLRRACAGYPRSPKSSVRVALYQTLQTELWLRAHAPDVAAGSGGG